MAQLTQTEVRYWLSEAESCEERQKKELMTRNNYPGLLNYYEGIENINPIYPHVGSAQRLAIINEYFPNTNALISEIMYQNPDIVCEALRIEAEGNENLMKSALMYAFDKADALIENRVALFDMLYAGYCAVEVGHIRDTEPLITIPGEPNPPDRRGPVERLVAGAKERFGTTDEVEEETEKEAPKQEEKYALPNERTYIRRWNPVNVPLDWRAERIRDRRYNLKKVYYSKAEFDAKYPEYKNKINVGEDRYSYATHMSQLHTKRIMCYEFQVRKRNSEYWTIVVCPMWGFSELDYFKRPYIHDGFDMKIGSLHKYGRLYPIAFAQINKCMQDELNEYVRHMKDVAEKNVPKRWYDKNKVKGDALVALESGECMDLVGLDGNGENAIGEVPNSKVANENKELITLFNRQKEKGWSVSDPKLAGQTGAKFATELEIQEAGFQGKILDIQEGLRILIRDELNATKDIIVSQWDGPTFFRVTGGIKPEFYAPQMAVNPLTGQPMVLNSLTDILTGDYFIRVDITSSLRPNKERRKKEIIDYLTWLLNPVVVQYLMSQGKMVNIEAIKKTASEFGLNPETLFIDAGGQGVLPQMPQAGAPVQQ